MDEEELNRQFLEEMNELEEVTVCVEIPGPYAFMVLAALQLALLHPGMSGAVRVMVEQFARGIEEQLAVSPAVTEAMRRGWKRDESVH
jgi:hypothetical protein